MNVVAETRRALGNMCACRVGPRDAHRRVYERLAREHRAVEVGRSQDGVGCKDGRESSNPRVAIRD